MEQAIRFVVAEYLEPPDPSEKYSNSTSVVNLPPCDLYALTCSFGSELQC